MRFIQYNTVLKHGRLPNKPIIDLGLSLSDKIFSFLLLLRPCNKFPFSSWVNLRAVAEQSSSHICDQRKNLSHLWGRLFKSQAKKKETHRKKKNQRLDRSVRPFCCSVFLLSSSLYHCGTFCVFSWLNLVNPQLHHSNLATSTTTATQ